MNLCTIKSQPLKKFWNKLNMKILLQNQSIWVKYWYIWPCSWVLIRWKLVIILLVFGTLWKLGLFWFPKTSLIWTFPNETWDFFWPGPKFPRFLVENIEKQTNLKCNMTDKFNSLKDIVWLAIFIHFIFVNNSKVKNLPLRILKTSFYKSITYWIKTN